MMCKRLGLFLLLFLATALNAADPITAPLPPAIPWTGGSMSLAAKAGDPWITLAEASEFRTTSTYEDTVSWLRRLTAAAPELRMVSIGKSPEGRDIWMVVASRERLFTPEALLRTGKPTLLAQAGIHAGEIDGKDAGMMLLRDMTVGRVGGVRPGSMLLDRVNFLFIPILNVDGHERSSPWGRINQRGPETIGWRTNARNLNLNRDYAKLDTDEVRAVVSVLDKWRPDLYFDLHVTDGADYQYDVTFGWNQTTALSPDVDRWIETMLVPVLTRDLRSRGHIPGPLVFPVAGDDVSKGIVNANAPPRFSNGYGDVRHIASLLVENHSLKPYGQRVLGMRVLLESALETLGREGLGLKRAISHDAEMYNDPVPLAWRAPQNGAPDTMEFLGIESRTELSPVSGALRTEWLGRPVTLRVPVIRQTEIATSVPRAKAYWIPPAWRDVAERLRIHGVRMQQTVAPREVAVDMYRLKEPKLATEAFEGRVGLETKTTVEKRTERFPAGSYRIPTDQPLGDLVTFLLEPASEDSFLRWGFFNEILQRTEYVEDYVLEPLATQMLAADPKLAEEFRKKIETDESFRASASKRLRFFYERTPYYDERWLLYPVARER